MIDLVKLHVRAGSGGHGSASFRREKFIPKGGPDGGDGGDGGSVVLVGRRDYNTLHHFIGKKEFRAQDGERGGKQRMFGHAGDDLIVEVPIGTVIWKINDEKVQQYHPSQVLKTRLEDIDKTLVAEITEDGQRLVLAQGGKGGRGNDRFKSSVNTTPEDAEPGGPGEEFWALFELKLIADMGLVGLPNAGKSTFLSMVTKANPKIANYPFTTLEPNLGVLALGGERDAKEIVIADIPGLIEGANEGKGLGIQFLRHVERCKALMYVLYLTEEQLSDESLSNSDKAKLLMEQFELLQKELKSFNPKLLKLPAMVTCSKADLYSKELVAEIIRELRGNKIEALFWSSVTKEGLQSVINRITELLK
jgi:GTPase